MLWAAAESWLCFAGSQEHNDKFHHWQGGQDGGMVAQLEEPKLFWCCTQRGGLAMRQVWDGGDITVHHRPETCNVTVSLSCCPSRLTLPDILLPCMITPDTHLKMHITLPMSTTLTASCP